MNKTNLRPLVATAFMLLLTSKSVFASDWKAIFSSDDSNGNETDWFIDLASVTKDGVLRRVTLKTTFEPFSQRGFNENARKWERKWISIETYDCQRMLVRKESLTVYYYDGTRWEDKQTQYPGSWRLISKGDESTIWGRVLKIVCGNK